MTRDALLKQWCRAEGGKKSALDAPQARECYAKLRTIIGHHTGVDIDDLIAGNTTSISIECVDYEAARLYGWKDGKPVSTKPFRRSVK